MHTGLWKENLKERDYIEDIGIVDRIILKWDLNGWEGVTSTYLVQDVENW